MRVITLKQPWATLMAKGLKRFETRSWQPFWTGPLAIHAAKSFPDRAAFKSMCGGDWRVCPLCKGTLRVGASWLNEHMPFCGGDDFPMTEGDLGGDFFSKNLTATEIDSMPVGKVVCVVDLFDWFETGDVRPVLEQLDRRELAFGNYEPDRFAWHTGNVRPLPQPVDARGYRKVWSSSSTLEAEIAEQLKGVEALALDESQIGVERAIIRGAIQGCSRNPVRSLLQYSIEAEL